MDNNCKKSDRSTRKVKDKSKTSKYFGSKKHIRIQIEKQTKKQLSNK
jgi:hypothetical protein